MHHPVQRQTMRIAVQSPYFLFADETTNFNGYDLAFFKLYKPAIYFPGWRRINLLRAYRRMRQMGMNPEEYEFVLTEAQLNKKADVLLGFCGRPDLSALRPLKKFKGLKAFHVMDYVFCAKESYQALLEGGVDYVLGYANHGKYCPFFQRFYPQFSNKVISVPFGFGNRFKLNIPFSERVKKCIAAGSVNPVDDPAVKNRKELMDYITYYSHIRWSHQWRRMLSEHETSLSDVMDSVLPKFPETKNLSYKAPDLFNRYQLFANDEGLMQFPPARTYEGVAAGALMVAANHPVYHDIGFKDGENCILHEPLRVDLFREKVKWYLDRPSVLEKIAANGHQMITTHYNHPQIAKGLHAELSKKLKVA